MNQNTESTDTDKMKELISHAASNGVRFFEARAFGLKVEFFDPLPEVEEQPEESEETGTDETENDSTESSGKINGTKREKEYPGVGMVSKEDSETLMNPLWKD